MNNRHLLILSFIVSCGSVVAMESEEITQAQKQEVSAVAAIDWYGKFQHIRNRIIDTAKTVKMPLKDDYKEVYSAQFYLDLAPKIKNNQIALDPQDLQIWTTFHTECANSKITPQQFLKLILENQKIRLLINKYVSQEDQKRIMRGIFEDVNQEIMSKGQLANLIDPLFNTNNTIKNTVSDTSAVPAKKKWYSWQRDSDEFDEEFLRKNLNESTQDDAASLALIEQLQEEETHQRQNEDQQRQDEDLARRLQAQMNPEQLPQNFAHQDDDDDEQLKLAKKLSLQEHNVQQNNNNNKRNDGKEEEERQEQSTINMLDCSCCLLAKDPKTFVLALSEDDRRQMLAYIRSDESIETFNPGITKKTQECMHTICTECKKQLARGEVLKEEPVAVETDFGPVEIPGGEQEVLIKLLCPTCNIRMRIKK